MSAFTERHVRAVGSVQAIWPRTRLVVVGGLAVEHHTRMPWRTTKDIDLALGIEVGDFPGPLDEAEDWERDPQGNEHCMVFEGSLRFDFLPVGPDAAGRVGAALQRGAAVRAAAGESIHAQECVSVPDLVGHPAASLRRRQRA